VLFGGYIQARRPNKITTAAISFDFKSSSMIDTIDLRFTPIVDRH